MKRVKSLFLSQCTPCFLFIFIGFFASSCASLRSVSVTSIPQNRTQKVVASVDKWIFLGINFNNDYVDELTANLRQKCKGRVTGLLTKYETTFYFLFMKDQITATGFCVDTNADARSSNSASKLDQGSQK